MGEMGRMYSNGKGIARRCLPFRRTPPSWVQISSNALVEQIVKLARKGATPSQIGVTLRDSHGIPQVKGVTGSKILRILRNQAWLLLFPRTSTTLSERPSTSENIWRRTVPTETPSSDSFVSRAESTDSPVTTVTSRPSAPPGDMSPRELTP